MKKLSVLGLMLFLTACSSPILSFFEGSRSLVISIKSPSFQPQTQGSRLLTPEMEGNVVHMVVRRLDPEKILHDKEVSLKADGLGFLTAEVLVQVPLNVRLSIRAEILDGTGRALVRGEREVVLDGNNPEQSIPLGLLPVGIGLETLVGGVSQEMTVEDAKSKIVTYDIDETVLNQPVDLNWDLTGASGLDVSIWDPSGKAVTPTKKDFTEPNMSLQFVPKTTGTYYFVFYNPLDPNPVNFSITSLISPLSLRYESSGATGGTLPGEQTGLGHNDSVLVEPPGDLVKDGYLFKEWNTKSDGTGTPYQPGVLPIFGAKNLRLFAQWRPASEIQMVSIEGGRFQRDGVSTNLTIVDPFLLGRYEVTQEQWVTVMGANRNPSSRLEATAPVENLSWFTAVSFCNKLSLRSGLEPVYSIDGITDPESWTLLDAPRIVFDVNKNGYRLPTEMEWMWAAMGGLQDSQTGNILGTGVNRINQGGADKPFAGFSGTDTTTELSMFAWNFDNSGLVTHPVGRLRPNELGIYDLSGNVWEMLWDWNISLADTTWAPAGSFEGYLGAVTGVSNLRTDRGASFERNYSTQKVHFAVNTGRGAFDYTAAANNTGLRLARNAPGRGAKVKVQYLANGATLDRSYTVSVPAGSPLTIPGNAAGMTKGAKVFNRWSLVSGGTSSDLQTGQAFLPGADTTLHAVWTDPGAPVSARMTMGTNETSWNEMAVDSQGNTYAVGYLKNNVQYVFGNGVWAAGGKAGTDETNGVLVKFDPFGQAQWARVADTAPGASNFHTVTVDPDGNVYVGGYQFGGGTFDYQGLTLTGGAVGHQNALVLSYDPQGTIRWGRVAHDTATPTGITSSEIYSLAFADGKLYAAGYQTGSDHKFVYDGGNANYLQGPNNKAIGILLKYGADGTWAWGKTIAAAETTADYRYGRVKADDTGVYVLGSFSGNITYTVTQDITLNPPGSESWGALIKYTIDGVATYVTNASSAPGNYVFSDLIMDDDAIYIVGHQGSGQYSYNNIDWVASISAYNALFLAVDKGTGSVNQVNGANGSAPDFSHFDRITINPAGDKILVAGRQKTGVDYGMFGGTVRTNTGTNLAAGVILQLTKSNLTLESVRTLEQSDISNAFRALAVGPVGEISVGIFFQADGSLGVNPGGSMTLTRPTTTYGNSALVRFLP